MGNTFRYKAVAIEPEYETPDIFIKLDNLELRNYKARIENRDPSAIYSYDSFKERYIHFLNNPKPDFEKNLNLMKNHNGCLTEEISQTLLKLGLCSDIVSNIFNFTF
jgi:hypothetical protein